ncbi:hypothetical protein Leryth_018659, partial [Lithospermum erythrorhizon]
CRESYLQMSLILKGCDNSWRKRLSTASNETDSSAKRVLTWTEETEEFLFLLLVLNFMNAEPGKLDSG